MDALQLLTQRRSIPKLLAPAPQGDALENMIASGLRAPDHGALTPWEFVVATGEGLDKLSAILKRAAEADDEEAAVIEKAANAPYRAPMVITVIARTKQHDKVPVIEQHISAGCAAQAMQMAAVAQGFQGFWRTGKWAYHLWSVNLSVLLVMMKSLAFCMSAHRIARRRVYLNVIPRNTFPISD